MTLRFLAWATDEKRIHLPRRNIRALLTWSIVKFRLR